MRIIHAMIDDTFMNGERARKFDSQKKKFHVNVVMKYIKKIY